MTGNSRIISFTLLALLGACADVFPQLPREAVSAAHDDATDAAGLAVAARVNGSEILLAECHRYLNRLPFIDNDNRDQHTPWALHVLIDRQIVLDFLRQRADLLAPGEVERALQARRDALATRGQLLETACADAGITEEVLARAIAWNLVWPRYLARTLTRDRLRKYFAQHAAEYDGRKLQVSHVLWRHDSTTDHQGLDQKVQEARRVLAKIRAGTVTFAEVARQYSDGPSAARDGELGWIERDGPMTESFSRAAFELATGQTSEPVVDQFGVHLIWCQAIKPGRRDLGDVRVEVERSARRELFEALVQRARRRAVVSLTGVVAPYEADQDLNHATDPDTVVIAPEELNE